MSGETIQENYGGNEEFLYREEGGGNNIVGGIIRIFYTVLSVGRWEVQCIILELLKVFCVTAEEGLVRRDEDALCGMSDLTSGWEV